MADKFIEVPTNIDDINILKRFLNELVDKLNSNALVSYPISYPTGYTGTIPYSYSTLVGGYTNTILEAAARADAISGDAKNYITNNLTTNVLQNTEDLATITEQFGTFYNDATAAAWYGLTVKSGELISGFTVSGVDSDTTTPGTAGSVFAVSADTFTVGRAIEDINDPAELAYITANGLPYGTMYNSSTGEIIPAFLIYWNGTSYDIFFNGKVTFTNVSGTEPLLQSVVDVQTAASAAQEDATAALTELTVIASDNILSQVEKPAVILDYSTIIGEQSGIDSQAISYGITTEKTLYDNAITTLTNYLNTLTIPTAWDDLTGNTSISGVTFRSKFESVYLARQALLNKIAIVAKDIADSKVLPEDVASAVNNNTTTIDGGKITTGSITSEHIITTGLDAGVIKAGVMYNTGGTASSYTMKIDLDNGEIHIK